MKSKFILPDHVAIRFFKDELDGAPTGNYYYARCPVCGDSSRNKRKKRMYLLKDQNWYVFCHNCGYSSGLTYFIKDYFPLKYDSIISQSVNDFFSEKKESNEDKAAQILNSLQKKQNRVKSFLRHNCVKLSDVEGILSLPKEDKNIIKEQLQYLRGRNIQKKLYSKFYYCHKVKLKEQGCYTNRIIIPFFDRDNDPYFFQARMTKKFHSPKYINWKNPGSHADMKPEYNEHHVNKKENVFIIEGLFDSFFVKNSVSTLGARMSKDRMRYFENKYPNRTFVLDNDKAGIEVMNKLFERGERCFIMPKMKDVKDLNDLAIKNNTYDLTDFVNKNSFSNLEGIFKLREYNY